MEPAELALARIIFKNRVLGSDGAEFEGLCTAILGYRYPDFRQVKPQGRIGDRKNDGFVPSQGTYFQIYGPEDLGASMDTAVMKATADLAGLREGGWDDIATIRHFRFVANDKYKGGYPTLEATLAELSRQHGLESCEPLLAKHLEDMLFSLTDDQILATIGFLPSPESIPDVEYDSLSEVIRAIHAASQSVDTESVLHAPDFEAKIEFNGLGASVASLLRVASYHRAAIEQYFELNSTFARQQLRDAVQRLYQCSRDEVVDSDELVAAQLSASDVVFFGILDRIGCRKTKQLQDAALVVLAYYFEACDIYQNPSARSEDGASA